MTVTFRFSDERYYLPRFLLRTPWPFFCLFVLRRQPTLISPLWPLWVIRLAQSFHPSTKFSRNSREARVVPLLEFRHIHMITANSYLNVARKDGGVWRNDLTRVY